MNYKKFRLTLDNTLFPTSNRLVELLLRNKVMSLFPRKVSHRLTGAKIELSGNQGSKSKYIDIYIDMEKYDISIENAIKSFISGKISFSIDKEEYKIIAYETHNKQVLPRILFGYGNSRIIHYKIVKPIFLSEMFKNTIDFNEPTTGRINKDLYKEHFTSILKNRLLNDLGFGIGFDSEAIRIDWVDFGLRFAKYNIGKKSRACVYGSFEINCVLPFFIGDFNEHGYGRIVIDKKKGKRTSDGSSMGEQDVFDIQTNKEIIVDSKDIVKTDKNSIKTLSIKEGLFNIMESKAARLGINIEEYIDYLVLEDLKKEPLGLVKTRG